MPLLAKQLKDYLFDNLGVSLTITQWPEEKRQPIFLRDLYKFFECTLLDIPCLLMVSRDAEEQTATSTRKHMTLVQERSGLEPIYVRSSISSYNRKRLIEHKISFIVPGSQMYLPILGIVLRERLKTPASAKTHKLGPSAQAALLYSLYNEDEDGLTPSGLADTLHYSPMTLSRAFDQLEATGLAHAEIKGRERVLRFKMSKKDLWEEAQQYLRSPVKKRIFARMGAAPWQGFSAGLSALSLSSMLAEPHNPTYALSAAQWKSLRESGAVVEIPMQEPDSVNLEIWTYDPQLFAKNDVVDCLSLFLSLKESEDERVESALESLMEKCKL